MAEVSFRIDPIHLEQMNRRIGEYLGLNYERSTLSRIVEEYSELEAAQERSWDIHVRWNGRDMLLDYRITLDDNEEPEIVLDGPDGFIEELDAEVVQPVLEEYEG
ncbi:MAG: hypothetical protein ABIP29_06895 [Candidatus Eisenbacteria bacterium]